MILTQNYTGCLSQATYLVADEESRQAVLVDPLRDVDQYLADAASQGLTIVGVVLTHFHADFVAGTSSWRPPPAPGSGSATAPARSSRRGSSRTGSASCSAGTTASPSRS